MKIWVDADACPVVIKDILFRAAERAKVTIVLVANQPLTHPTSNYIRSITVGRGFDLADNEIVSQASKGDLVITADIPLAADVLTNGAHALTPRGERYTTNNIKARLTMRDFMDTLRGSGEHAGGPPPLSMADRRAFANELDGFIMRHRRTENFGN